MRHLSLFTGIGGFDLGFDRAGLETVGQVEIDPHARSVLERSWPDVPRWDDVTEVHGAGVCVHGSERVGRVRVAHPGTVPDTSGDDGVERPYGGEPDRRVVDNAGEEGGVCESVGCSQPHRVGCGADPRTEHRPGDRPGRGHLPGRTDPCGRCLPGFDVLTGGFPCQDISVAGRRAGLAGDRSGLWFEFARLIAETRPTWVVIENVPGLLSSNGGRDMGTILRHLGEHGYGFAWRVLDSQWFGVPQRRRRVFIVGHSGGSGAAQVLAVGQGSRGDPPPRRETGANVAPTLAARAGGGGGLGTNTELDGGLIVGSLTAHLGSGGVDDNHAQAGHLVAFQATAGNRVADETHHDQSPPVKVPPNGPPAVAFHQNQRNEVRLTDVAGALGGGGGKPGSQGYPAVLQIMGRGRADGYADEIDDSGVAQTLRAGDGGSSRSRQILDRQVVRRLTPTECARLQGFPDTWNDHLSDTQRYRQFGNAVTVNVAEWLGHRLHAYTSTESSRP